MSAITQYAFSLCFLRRCLFLSVLVELNSEKLAEAEPERDARRTLDGGLLRGVRPGVRGRFKDTSGGDDVVGTANSDVGNSRAKSIMDIIARNRIKQSVGEGARGRQIPTARKYGG